MAVTRRPTHHDWRTAWIVVGCALVGLLAGQIFDAVRVEFVLVVAIVAVAVIASEGRGPWVRVTAIGVSGAAAVIAAALITDGSPGDAVPGLVDGPRRLLSTEWPSPLEPSMVAAVALLLSVMTAVAVVTARSGRWHLGPLLPILTTAVVVMALSAPSRPAAGLVAALAVVAMAVAALGRAETPVRALGVPALVSVAVCTAAGLGASVVVATPDRADPRRTEPAATTAVLLDPVEETVAMRATQPAVDLMTIVDRSPLTPAALPTRWRVSAFDSYDGQRWTPTADLRPIGGRLSDGARDRAAGMPASPLRYEIRYHGAQIDLVPVPGPAVSVDRDVETDVDRVAIRLGASPDATTSVTVEAFPPPTVRDATMAGIAERQVDDLSARLSDRAATLAGDGTVSDRLGRVARTMRSDWQLDALAPGGGQQLALVTRFVDETLRGTREQFVTGYVLLVRALGVDARIAAGFMVPPEELGPRFTIRTDHAAIWPEVRLADGRWLAIDPVPVVEAGDDDEPPPPPEAQSPAAAQPPIAPPADDLARDDEVVDDAREDADGLGAVRTWLVRGSLAGGLALGPIVIAIAVVLGAKWARRRRRATAEDPADRVRGHWATATDALVDAGLTIPPTWTDGTIADRAADVVGVPSQEAQRLATMASRVTFGSPSADEADLLAADAASAGAAIDAAISGSRTHWARLRWRCSLRSLRPSTSSPVDA